MSEVLDRWSARELREQYVIDHYWPVGEPAARLRAKLTAEMIMQATSWDRERAKVIDTLWQQLGNTYDPEAAARAAERDRHDKRPSRAVFGVL